MFEFNKELYARGLLVFVPALQGHHADPGCVHAQACEGPHEPAPRHPRLRRSLHSSGQQGFRLMGIFIGQVAHYL